MQASTTAEPPSRFKTLLFQLSPPDASSVKERLAWDEARADNKLKCELEDRSDLPATAGDQQTVVISSQESGPSEVSDAVYTSDTEDESLPTDPEDGSDCGDVVVVSPSDTYYSPYVREGNKDLFPKEKLLPRNPVSIERPVY
ncbi:hypothetical protein DICSQDRAFT_172278 [Dichomitus squalens LYAD-421 SS1]|uniref:Uncharacterized protein n=2 Tax=Dichomitus squalens TaxID=114155 RepID=A0A4Q9PE46_9APHY|nr:uncharacterized protein DICSQDRAFT_172278 [Dichomitus squalens LYAD-421 SS1]EJF59131.1 hypothetical protein DICSQDRAFT_172278 [Dichomitus squalens LYAD-421 SS1]TBU53119.1 hypothetical protein BD310DRAFT_952290 [Dichomitus squalens]